MKPFDDPMFWVIFVVFIGCLAFLSWLRPRPDTITPGTLDAVKGQDVTVYVYQHAIIREYGNRDWIAYCRASYSEEPRPYNVKLVRQGSGFKVYGHKELPDGQWVACR